MLRPAMIVHGGVGQVEMERAAAVQHGCEAALAAGWSILECGGDALAAVVASVIELENDPHFNAGLGSVLTSAGTVEMDASVMDGATLAAGTCGAVGGIRNPVALARAILDESTHVMLVGAGAEAFAEHAGVIRCAPEQLITERQRQRWRDRRDASAGGGTVGAVAIDRAGHVAAATSTGGLLWKHPGRVGDSGIIGAGTYADDRAGAASATGAGEAIMRVAVAKAVVDRLRDGCDPTTAAQIAVRELATRTLAMAGVIVVDSLGRIGCAYNSVHLPRAWRDARATTSAFGC